MLQAVSGRGLVSRILSAVVVLPLVLFALSGKRFALWRCQSDGQLRPRCCCPQAPATAAGQAEEAPAPVQAPPALSRPACCDVQHQQVEKAPTELVRPGPASDALLLAAPLAATVLPRETAPAPSKLPPRTRAPDEGAGGRRYVLACKQSFLI